MRHRGRRRRRGRNRENSGQKTLFRTILMGDNCGGGCLGGGGIVVRVTAWAVAVWAGEYLGGRVSARSGNCVAGRGYPCERACSSGGMGLPCCRFAIWLAPFAFAALHCFVKQARGRVAAWEFNTFPQDEYGKTVLPSLHPASSALYNTIRRKEKELTLQAAGI